MHLILYPADLTKAQYETGAASICALTKATDPRVSQVINGDWSLSFDHPLDDRLVLGGLVQADGQLYRIHELERVLTREGPLLTVRALHLMYDLRDRLIVNIETAELTPGGINQRTALQQVLNDTAFTDGIVDTDILVDYLDILQKDAMWALKEQVLRFWGGELQPDNWAINLRKQLGADRGVHLRYGKNITGVRLQESLDGVITRLHVKGYKDANFESINEGKDFIDSPLLGAYPTIREGLVTFQDDDLPEDLLSKGQAYLTTVDKPRIKLTVDLAKVRTSDQYRFYKDLETVELGDMVTVYNPVLQIDIQARVQRREFDPVTGENERVELGNDDRSLYSAIASARQAAEVVRMITDRKGRIRGELLGGVVDLLTTQLMASGSYSNAQVLKNKGMLLENTNGDSPDFGALYLGPGILAVADTKDSAGSWVWRTFGTGQGFSADEINAGVLNAAVVKILGSELFYWDGENLTVKDPEAPEMRQIRLGCYDGTKYGLAFTQDGGQSWQTALGFNGLTFSIADMPAALMEQINSTSSIVNQIAADQAQTSQYIKIGLLSVDAQGRPQIGIAMGENLSEVYDENGNVVIDRQKAAQVITPGRTTWLQDNIEQAFVSDGAMHMQNAEIKQKIKQGQWETVVSPMWALKWAGD